MDTSRLSSFRQRLGRGERPELREVWIIGRFEAYQVVRGERKRCVCRLHFSLCITRCSDNGGVHIQLRGYVYLAERALG